jgi:hypothetical protein
MNLTLHLFHGRKDPDDNLDDWGTVGPFLLIESVNWTYGSVSIISFTQGETTEEILLTEMMREDMIFYDGVWYGDFCISNNLPSGQNTQEFDSKRLKDERN